MKKKQKEKPIPKKKKSSDVKGKKKKIVYKFSVEEISKWNKYIFHGFSSVIL